MEENDLKCLLHEKVFNDSSIGATMNFPLQQPNVRDEFPTMAWRQELAMGGSTW
jgi:hypothetical protein